MQRMLENTARLDRGHGQGSHTFFLLCLAEVSVLLWSSQKQT